MTVRLVFTTEYRKLFYNNNIHVLAPFKDYVRILWILGLKLQEGWVWWTWGAWGYAKGWRRCTWGGMVYRLIDDECRVSHRGFFRGKRKQHSPLVDSCHWEMLIFAVKWWTGMILKSIFPLVPFKISTRSLDHKLSHSRPTTFDL